MSERLGAGLLCIAVLGAVGCSQPPPRPSAPPAPATPPAQIAPWGLDLAARDSSVKPGDDFYGYADGHWLDTHQIPPDRTRWGSFDELGERSHDQVRSIVEALPDGAPAASNEQKVGDDYRSYLDTEAIERLGLTPAPPPRVCSRSPAIMTLPAWRTPYSRSRPASPSFTGRRRSVASAISPGTPALSPSSISSRRASAGTCCSRVKVWTRRRSSWSAS